VPHEETPAHVIEMLRDAYEDPSIGLVPEEHEYAAARITHGHKCVSTKEAADFGDNLTYGEMLPDGFTKAVGEQRLDVEGRGQGRQPAGLVLELGMGTGKLAMQCFLQCPSAGRVIGVELAESRYTIGAEAAKRLAALHPQELRVAEEGSAPDGEPWLRLEPSGAEGPRSLELRCGDMFKVITDEEIAAAEVVILEVAFPDEMCFPVCELLKKCSTGCRLLIFYPLEQMWMGPGDCPFHIWMSYRDDWDFFATSWQPFQGHPFYTYRCDKSRKATITEGGAVEERWYKKITAFALFMAAAAGTAALMI